MKARCPFGPRRGTLLAVSDAFFEGMKIGRYEVITRLSVGGMAELYLARLLGPGGFQKLVALKMILPDVRSDERFVQMFLDEAQLTAELNHPNLGQVFELGQEPTGELYLALEFLAGQNLSVLLRTLDHQRRKLPVELAASIGRDICLGLHAAHSHLDALGRPKPVIHRDVAPKNVMVTFEGHVKVIDFGIAMASGRRVRTQTGVVKGTPTYMAPEQHYGERATPRTDVFSAGVVLHECLTGQRLFTIDVPPQRFAEVIKAPSTLNARVPRALDEVCLRALAIEPTERFESARDFGRAIVEAAPGLAEPDELGALMTELFGTQRASLGQLVDAARNPREPNKTLSQLAKRALAQPRATPVPTAPEVPAAAPLPTSLLSPATRKWAYAGLALVGVLALVIVIGAIASPAAPPADVTAKPIDFVQPTSVPKAPVDPLEQAERTVGTNPAAALEIFDSVLTKQPTHWRALMGAARALQALGNDEQARARLERAAAQPVGAISTKEHVETYLELSKAELHANHEEAAKKALGAALELDAARTRATVAGTALEPLAAEAAKPQPRPAAPQPSRGRTLSPSDREQVNRFYEQAKALRSAHQYEAAITVLRQCLQQFPADPDCIAMLASVYATRGGEQGNLRDNDEAMRLYRQFLQIAPRDHKLRPRVEALLMPP